VIILPKRIKITEKYNYNKIKRDINILKFYYEELFVGNIGKSILGEEIKYIKLGEGRNKIFINAAHHANECITSLIAMMFAEKYLELKRQNKTYKGYYIEELWEKSSLYIVPMVNPDGVNLCLEEEYVLNNKKYKNIWQEYTEKLHKWKANIRGVDLNLNYPSGFEKERKIKYKKGIINPGPLNYGGPNYLSEPETRAIYEFTKLNKFDLTFLLQLYGREIFCDCNEIKLKKAYELGKKFENVSGYKLINEENKLFFSEYNNWFMSEFKKPSFKIKIGKEKKEEILTAEKINKFYDEVEEIFLISLDN